jgi:hypothetical protein
LLIARFGLVPYDERLNLCPILRFRKVNGKSAGRMAHDAAPTTAHSRHADRDRSEWLIEIRWNG